MSNVISDSKYSVRTSWVIIFHLSEDLLMGDVIPDPLLTRLRDLLREIVWTWSITRCCADLIWMSEGTARDVSPTCPTDIADLKGSSVIFYGTFRLQSLNKLTESAVERVSQNVTVSSCIKWPLSSVKELMQWIIYAGLWVEYLCSCHAYIPPF